jgi:hypothetical protein
MRIFSTSLGANININYMLQIRSYSFPSQERKPYDLDSKKKITLNIVVDFLGFAQFTYQKKIFAQ